MILPVGLNQWQRAESVKDRFGCLGATESLQQFLEHQACRDDRISAIESFAQGNDFFGFNRTIAPQCQRPDAGIDQKRHDLERSAL